MIDSQDRPRLELLDGSELQSLAPFGRGNPSVSLMVAEATFRDCRPMGEGKHVRFTVHSRGARMRGRSEYKPSLKEIKETLATRKRGSPPRMSAPHQTSKRSESLVDAVITLLGSSGRNRNVAMLGYELSIAARSAYEAAGSPVKMTAGELNELAMVVFKQLAADAGVTDIGYPDTAFAQMLVEKTGLGGCESQLTWAVERTNR